MTARARRVITSLSAALVVASVAASFLAAFPGTYTSDSLGQLGQAVNGVYGDWHPPVMAAWWSVLLKATGSAWSLLAFHHLLLGMALLSMGALFVRHGAAWAFAPLAVVPLFPTVANFSALMWKDVGFAFALAFVTAVAPWRPRGALRGLQLTALCLAAGYAGAVRVNGLPAILPLLILALGGDARHRVRPILTALVLLMALAMGGRLVTYRVLDAHREHITSYTQLHDLAAILALTGDDRIPRFSFNSPETTPAMLVDTYRKSAEVGSGNFFFFVYPGERPLLRFVADDAEHARLSDAWLSAIRAHPEAYLQHRFRFMFKLLRIGETWPYYWFEPHQDATSLSPASLAPLNPRVAALLAQDHAIRVPGRELSRSLLRASVETGGRSMYFGWRWLVAALVVCAMSIPVARRAPELGRVAGLAAGSGIIYTASYLPVVPASDFRYLYWLVLSTILAMIALAAAVCVALRASDRVNRARDVLETR